MDELEEEVRRMEKIAGDEEVREVSLFFPFSSQIPLAMLLRLERNGVLGVGDFWLTVGVFR